MSSLAILLKRYGSAQGSKTKGFPPYYNIDATTKWAEYSIDELKLIKLIQTADFIEKFDAEKALSVVRRKIEYMYKHKNFDHSEAVAYYKKLKRAINY
jgi:hypothetical protein